MALPKALRRLAPDRVRDDVRLRSVFVGAGLIPPRTMHSDDDAAILRATAAGRRRVVELGVYEGSSAVVLCEVLDPERRAAPRRPLRPSRLGVAGGLGGDRGREPARRRPRRAPPRRARSVTWHVDYSAAVAERWERRGRPRLHRRRPQRARASAPTGRAGTDSWSPAAPCCSTTRALSQEGGRGLAGPTAVVDSLFRGLGAVAGWSVLREADRTVAVVRSE